MTPFLSLLSRELRARWMLLAASLAMGIFVALVPLLTRGPSRPEEVRTAAAMTVALIWGTLLALGLGATCLARDLGERRLAFDFRLPAPAEEIWAARLLGAYLVAVLAGLFVLVPSAPLGLDFSGVEEAIGSLLAWLPLWLAALLLVAHVGGMALFGDRTWSGVDLASFSLVVAATIGAQALLRPWRATAAAWDVVMLILALLLLALLAATLQQLRHGRSERERGHRAFSLTLLGLVLVPAAAAFGYVRWYLAPEPGNLIGWKVKARGLGADWVALEGEVDRRGELWMRFVLRPGTQQVYRLGPFPPGLPSGWPRISGDGLTLAWLERHMEDGAASRQLVTLEASIPGAHPLRTPLAWRTPISAWALSRDATRIATLQRTGDYDDPRRVVVESVARGELISALLLPECRSGGTVHFASEDRLLVACAPRDWAPVETAARLYFAIDLREQRLGPLDPAEPRDWASEDVGSDSVIRDESGKWLWRDPASGALVPLLDEAQYRAR